MRTVGEWIGKDDDAIPPPRVRLRIFDANGGRCHICTAKIMPGCYWQADHVVALINGGKNAFDSLPPLMAERFNSPDALRKYALVKGGFCTSDSVTCPSHADALRVAAFVKPMDEFALVTVKKNVVTHFVPKSQSFKSMGKEEFQASKTRVLEIIADLIGVSADELKSSEPTQVDYMAAG